MSDLTELLKIQTEAINRAYLAGHQAGRAEGYRAGFNDGIEEAQRIINQTFPRLTPEAQTAVPQEE